FKALSEAEVAGLEKGVEAIKIGVNYKEQAAWNWKMFNIVYIDFLRYVQIKWNFKLGWNWLESLPGSHNVIDPEVYFIQNEQQFKNALANGSFKKFISPAEVQMLEEQFAERQALANGTKLMCESIFK
ncbi:MAG: hypothetical protein ACXWRE_11245, partial [Pseudobdellovibrionaceae bacterium]